MCIQRSKKTYRMYLDVTIQFCLRDDESYIIWYDESFICQAWKVKWTLQKFQKRLPSDESNLKSGEENAESE